MHGGMLAGNFLPALIVLLLNNMGFWPAKRFFLIFVVLLESDKFKIIWSDLNDVLVYLLALFAG